MPCDLIKPIWKVWTSMEQEFPKPLFYPIDGLSEGGVWKKINLIVFSFLVELGDLYCI